MKLLKLVAACGALAIMGGCATTDGPETVFMQDATADCRPSAGANAPVCKTTYWSSKDGRLDKPRRDD